MSQTGDYDIANASGSTVRQDINDTLTNILTANSGGSAPSYKQAGTLWLDTSANPDVLKYYTGNETDGWLPFLEMKGSGKFAAGNNSVLVSSNGFIQIAAIGGTPYIDFKRRDTDSDCRLIQSNDSNYDLKIETGGDVSNLNFQAGNDLTVIGSISNCIGTGFRQWTHTMDTQQMLDADSGGSDDIRLEKPALDNTHEIKIMD